MRQVPGLVTESVILISHNLLQKTGREHPVRDWKLDKSNTLYYIVPLKNRFSNDPQKNYYGPYLKYKFEKMREVLKVNKTLDFTIVIKSLE